MTSPPLYTSFDPTRTVRRDVTAAPFFRKRTKMTFDIHSNTCWISSQWQAVSMKSADMMEPFFHVSREQEIILKATWLPRVVFLTSAKVISVALQRHLIRRFGDGDRFAAHDSPAFSLGEPRSMAQRLQQTQYEKNLHLLFVQQNNVEWLKTCWSWCLLLF